MATIACTSHVTTSARAVGIARPSATRGLAMGARKPAPSRGALAVSAKAVKAPARKYQVDDEVTHSLTTERLEVVKSLEDFAENELLGLLKPVEKSWQPQTSAAGPSN